MIHYNDDSTLDTYFDAPHSFEIALKFGSLTSVSTEDWYFGDQIIKLQNIDAIFSGNPTIGSVMSKQLSGSLFVGDFTSWSRLIDPSGTIPEDAVTVCQPVYLAWRCFLTAGAGMTAWHTEGPWYIKGSSYDPTTGVLSFSASDKLNNADSKYMKIDWRSCFKNDEETCFMTAVAVDIATILGTPWNSASTDLLLSCNCSMPRPDDETTMRELLRQIGAVCGANVRLRWDGTYADGVLELVPFNNEGTSTSLSTKYGGVTLTERSDLSDYWDVCLTGGDDGDALSTHTEQTVVTCRYQADVPFATNAMCDRILASIQGQAAWRYQGYRITEALLDMRAEAGDRVAISVPTWDGSERIYGLIIGQIVRSYDAACLAEVSAPDLARREVDPYVAEEWAE